MKIPRDPRDCTLKIGDRSVQLTNLDKVFWPKERITKGDVLQYYADVSAAILPHLHDRAMVMKRYPNGVGKPFFFMKRIPQPHPEWVRTCRITHSSGNIIDFPMIQDLAALMWVVNLGCIDLNQWYATCDDVDRPDYLHFDLDPVPGASFDAVRETALAVRDALERLEMPCYAKTTGSRGIHVYVPIVRGPVQKDVWTFAKALALSLAKAYPKLITAEYRVAKRPARASAGRLQSERVGPDARERLFSAASAERDGVDAAAVARDRARRAHRGLHDQKRAGARAPSRRPVEAAARPNRPRAARSLLRA